MMKDNDFERPVDISAPPEQPHFDDVAAVMAAQPVVSLEQIDATLKNRRRWFLAGAFLLAMVLGAASALVASYVKLRNLPVTASEASAGLDVEPEPVAVAEPVSGETPVTKEKTDEPDRLNGSREEPKRSSVRRSVDVAPVRGDEDLDEDEELDRIREAILHDEWQERRARRANRRERRRTERYNHRDLSNLDEIFEGPRRRP